MKFFQTKSVLKTKSHQNHHNHALLIQPLNLALKLIPQTVAAPPRWVVPVSVFPKERQRITNEKKRIRPILPAGPRAHSIWITTTTTGEQCVDCSRQTIGLSVGYFSTAYRQGRGHSARSAALPRTSVCLKATVGTTLWANDNGLPARRRTPGLAGMLLENIYT